MEASKFHFEKLTPIDNLDLAVYQDALDYVFRNSDIKNIAISGAYSAGKSSVLASYKNKHKELSFLHISLANFGASEQPKEETEIKESVLEGKILNQLIHQIPPENIPQTNFRVKRGAKPKTVIKRTMETVLFCIIVLYCICFDFWKGYVSSLPENWLKSVLALFIHPYALMIDGICIALLSSVAIYRLIKIQMNKNILRKLSVKGNEIEIFEESDDSYFDKYLNEVLYLFKNAKADVIVFEDMDRFNANKIFTRLREVNTLVNTQLQGTKKPLRFFYLLRDDIFSSKDRTKFFDYILPIVPVVDGSNSYDQFIVHLKKSGLFERFNESFLQGLSLYIDDMRILKNIYNEFVIYYNRLNTIELDCNKMLAIITYKNIFPDDFASLQLNQGFIYTLFSRKEEFIAEEIVGIENTIKEKEKSVKLVQNEHLQMIRELDVAIADKYLKNYRSSWPGKADTELTDFIMSNLDKNALKEYKHRRQNLEDKLEGNIGKLEKEIQELKHKLKIITDQPLHEIITRDNIDKIFGIDDMVESDTEADFSRIRSSEYFDLLKYLIRDGYIDETYADYMTYFYENSLSRIDKMFLRSITDKKAKDYTYQLKNPELVVSRLRTADFDQEEILNFDLLTYLLQAQFHPEYLKRFMEQLKNKENFKFIGAFFDTTTEMSAYVKCLNLSWPEVFWTAVHEETLTERQIRRYSICSIYYSDDTTIESVNQDNCLCDYISNMRDYLAISDLDSDKIKKLIHIFAMIGVRFKGFDYEILDKALFQAVYEKSLYEINGENLQLVQREVLGIKDDKEIRHRNYTILCSFPEAAITQYMNQNINEYFDVMMQMSGGTILDDEKIAITVLNNAELTEEYKRSYIVALDTIIMQIDAIKDASLWALLLDARKVYYCERNIMKCFNVFGLNKSVIAYINSSALALNFSETEVDDSDAKQKLFDSVTTCASIDNLKYEQILVSLNFSLDTFSFADISDDKLAILIDANIIKMTNYNLGFMRENYPEQNFRFINRNMEKYIDIMDASLFSQNELSEILAWDISDELKIELLTFSDGSLSIIGKNYSPAVCVYILDNNQAESDLLDLFSSFDQWDASVQKRILHYAEQNIAGIIDNPAPVSEKLASELFRSNRINEDIKIGLLIAKMPELNQEQIKEILELLGLTNYIKLFQKGTRPKFEINDTNERLLGAFKDIGAIESFEEDSAKEGYYGIVRPKRKQSLSRELL